MFGLVANLKLAGIVGVVGLAAIAVAYGVGHHDAARDAQVRIDELNTKLAAANEVIRFLREDNAKNEILLEKYHDSIDVLTDQIVVQIERIQDLEANDPSVAEYLRTPIPPALACLLNHGTITGSAECGDPAPAGGARPTLPRSQAQTPLGQR